MAQQGFPSGRPVRVRNARIEMDRVARLQTVAVAAASFKTLAKALQAVRYLCEQFYLDPHPKELMLRNHV